MEAHRRRKITLRCLIALPGGYRRAEFLTFHGRDPKMVAERVDAARLIKGLAWEGLPACLTVTFKAQHATAQLAVDGAVSGDGRRRLRFMALRMLGLTQDVGAFEELYGGDPEIGALLAARPGLRVPLCATPFEAITWAIIGQQISLQAAVAIRRRFIDAAGPRHSSGIRCFPDVQRVLAMSGAELGQIGFSRTKAEALLAVSRSVERNVLPLDEWAANPPVADITKHLQEIRGVGPWTINYGLLRGFGWSDASLHGDVAVRRGIQRLLASEDKVSERQARHWLARFSPWRTLVAAHLWAQ